MIDVLLYIGLAICAGVVIFIGPFVAKMQATTLWVGKKIAPKGLDAEAPRGFQDAITPSWQDKFNTILPISYVLIFAIGTWIHWYLGATVLILSVILMSVVQRFYPSKLHTYLNIIIGAMNNKLADYVRDRDTMRANAAQELLTSLQEFYLEVREGDLDVPSMTEAKEASLGR